MFHNEGTGTNSSQHQISYRSFYILPSTFHLTSDHTAPMDKSVIYSGTGRDAESYCSSSNDEPNSYATLIFFDCPFLMPYTMY